jgi:uncharacterized protein YndB with AHSA1/START domain
MTNATADKGTLEQLDGDQWRLQFRRRFNHAPEKVWRAVTEPEHLAAWFPHEIHGDFTPGSSLRFTSKDMPDFAFEGKVLACEPPRLLEFTWGTDTLRFEIQPDGDGSTFTLFDTIEEVGKAARDGAGWHSCLDALAAHLDGRAAPEGRWKQVHPDYVAAFGPEASTIGPPEGHPEA